VIVILSPSVVLYVLSYAPYLAVRYEKPTPVTIGVLGPHYDQDNEYFANTTHAFFAPVEWLIDQTSLDKPLLVWADVWNVRGKIEHDSLMRHISNSKEWQEFQERRLRRHRASPTVR